MPAYATWLVYAGVWSFVGALSWTTTAVYLVREVGMSPLQLVLTGTALEVSYFIFEIPTGVVADLYSRRISLVIAAVISGLAMIMTGAVPTVAAILVAAAIWGAGWTFRSGAEDAWLADEIGPERLGLVYQRAAQLERVTGLLGIGAAVGLALVDLQLPLLAAGAVTLVLAAFLAVAMPEHGFVKPERTQRGQVREAMATARTGARLVRSHRVLLLVLGIGFVVGMWAEGFDRLWEAHLLLEVGLPELAGLGDVAWFGLIGAGTLVLSFAVAAPLVSRVERLDQVGMARFLLVMHGLLIVTALGFALASVAVARARRVLGDHGRPRTRWRAVPDVAQRHDHRLIGPGDGAVDRRSCRERRRVGRRSAARRGRHPLVGADRAGYRRSPPRAGVGAVRAGCAASGPRGRARGGHASDTWALIDAPGQAS